MIEGEGRNVDEQELVAEKEKEEEEDQLREKKINDGEKKIREEKDEKERSIQPHKNFVKK